MAGASRQPEAASQPAAHREGSKQWADLVRNSSKPSSVFQLRKWHEEERVIAKEELRNLGFCLVAFILGRFPGRLAVDNVRKSWNVESSYSLHEKGWMIFRFHNEEDRDSVLLKGPYETLGAQWLMKKLPPFFKFNEACFSSVPTWIRLQGLPLECWTKNALGKLASHVGEPLAADECTANMSKTSFARILVEVDVTQPLVRQICTTLPDGSQLEQEVIYEREPQICSKCKRIGHKEQLCRLHSSARKPMNAQMHHAAQSLQLQTEQPLQLQTEKDLQLKRPSGEGSNSGQEACTVDVASPTATALPVEWCTKSPTTGKKAQMIAAAAHQVAGVSSPWILQASTVTDLLNQQLNSDGSQDVVVMVNAQQGRNGQQPGEMQGAAASCEQTLGRPAGQMQTPAEAQLPTATQEVQKANQGVLQAEFPPLAAGGNGLKKMQTRNASAAKLAAAVAVNPIQQNPAQVLNQPSTPTQSAATTQDQTLCIAALEDTQYSAPEDDITCMAAHVKEPEQPIAATSSPQHASLAEDQADHVAAVPTAVPKLQKWETRTTRSGKKRR